jgi:hypothetical protein
MSGTAALLDEGARTLAETRRVTDRAAWLQAQTRELLFTYRSHRLCVIAGGSGVVRDRRAIIRALASEPTKTFAGLSRGGICVLCGSTIRRGEPEYEIESPTLTVTVDVDCFKMIELQITEARPND